MKRLVVALALLSLLAGCSSADVTGVAKVAMGGQHKASASHTPNPRCAEVFVRSVVHDQSGGLWGCMSERLQLKMFDQLGWTSDGDVQAFLDKNKGTEAKVYRAWPHNPVREDNGWWTWHYFVAPVMPDGQPDWRQGASFAVALNDQGKIEVIG